MIAQHRIDLPPAHPGFADPIYRARRDAIAAYADAYASGGPIPRVRYTSDEHAVWRCVWQHLRPMHAQHVARDVAAVLRALPLGHDRIPQLAEISAILRPATGFTMAPVAGLVPPRRFFAALEHGEFLSTQYVRHGTRPLYTPEPDIVHELVGHAATLADPRLADLNRRFGRAARHADPDRLAAIERVYWFSLEFGACFDEGEVRAVGAGLLSSAGELARLPTATLRTWDLDAIARTDYDTTDYQPCLFVAPSYETMLDDLERWLDAITAWRPGARTFRSRCR